MSRRTIAAGILVVDEITVIGSRCGPFIRAIELPDSGRVDVKPLVAARYPLEQFADAFDHAKRGLKVILNPNLPCSSRQHYKGASIELREEDR